MKWDLNILPQFDSVSTGIMLKSIIHSNTCILELLIFEYFFLLVVSSVDMYSATNVLLSMVADFFEKLGPMLSD